VRLLNKEDISWLSSSMWCDVFSFFLFILNPQGKWIVAQDDEEARFLNDMEVKAKRLKVPVHFISQAERMVRLHFSRDPKACGEVGLNNNTE